jgi:hypothetical protein
VGRRPPVNLRCSTDAGSARSCGVPQITSIIPVDQPAGRRLRSSPGLSFRPTRSGVRALPGTPLARLIFKSFLPDSTLAPPPKSPAMVAIRSNESPWSRQMSWPHPLADGIS